MDRLVSIIVPVYNEEINLTATLESLVKQNYEKIEIVLVDDGSTDSSLDICRSYGKNDKRIRIYSQKNKGVSSARNYGIRKSKGEYIVFVDSDDILKKEAILDLMQIQKLEDSDIIMYESETFSEPDNIKFQNNNHKYAIKRYTKKEFFREKLPCYVKSEKINALWSKMYKANLIKGNKIYFDESISIAEDLLFNFEYLQKIQNIVIYPKELYYYRVNQEDSLTTLFNPYKHEQLMYVNNLMKDISVKEKDEHLISSINKIRIKNIYSVIRDYIENTGEKSENKERIKEIVKKEKKQINPVKNDLIYKFLQIILYTENYTLIILVVKIIIFLRHK